MKPYHRMVFFNKCWPSFFFAISLLLSGRPNSLSSQSSIHSSHLRTLKHLTGFNSGHFNLRPHLCHLRSIWVHVSAYAMYLRFSPIHSPIAPMHLDIKIILQHVIIVSDWNGDKNSLVNWMPRFCKLIAFCQPCLQLKMMNIWNHRLTY